MTTSCVEIATISRRSQSFYSYLCKHAYEDGEAFIDFLGREYSSWPSFFGQLELFYTKSSDVLTDFLLDLESRYGGDSLFWIQELMPIFEHDPLFQQTISDMGLLLTDTTGQLDTGDVVLSFDDRVDNDWYLGINERLKRHPAFESDVDRLLAGILT